MHQAYVTKTIYIYIYVHRYISWKVAGLSLDGDNNFFLNLGDYLDNVGSSTSQNTIYLHGLLQG
jgi:hypothetical protein